MQILLPTSKSVNSSSSDMQVGVSLDRDYDYINEFDIKEKINSHEVYLEERNSCTKYRLILTVDPMCTNILFNPTSIILDSSGNRVVDKLLDNKHTQAIYSPSQELNYTYHCGYDIFDNFLFRTNLFKEASKLDDRIKGGVTNPHIFISDDIKPFSETISNVLIENNGWVSFRNPTKINIYKKVINNNTVIYNKEPKFSQLLKYKNSCDTIDMFPTREMFSFNPIVINNSSTDENNNFQIEENWKTIITYPFKNDKEHFLVKGGIPVLYKTALGIGEEGNPLSMPVLQLKTAYNNGLRINDEIEITYTLENQTDPLKKIYKVYKVVDDNTFLIHDDKSLTNALKPRIKRRINGVVSDYYMRKFRKLPNWATDREEVTINNIEQKLNQTPQDFTKTSYDLAFANNAYGDTLTQTVFTDSIDVKYLTDNLGRPLSEIYVTIIKNNDKNSTYQKYWSELSSGFELESLDDTNLYYKNNKTDRGDFKVNYPSIHLIHNIIEEKITLEDDNDKITVPYIYKVKNSEIVSDNTKTDVEQPELVFPFPPIGLEFNENGEMYGDIVEFNSLTFTETSLLPLMLRFNTKQRESYDDNDRLIKFHEIYQDDDEKGLNSDGTSKLSTYDVLKGVNCSITTQRQCDGNGNISTDFIYKGILTVGPRPEGYYYKAHHKIQLKNWSEKLSQSFLPLVMFDSGNGTINKNINKLGIEEIQIHIETPILKTSDLVRITWTKDNVFYDKFFNVRIDEKNKYTMILPNYWLLDGIDYSDIIDIRKYDANTPYYAKNIGNGRFVWRDLLDDGVIENTNNKNNVNHVFTNGHFYLNENIKFYLKRQDPFEKYGMLYLHFPNDIYGDEIYFKDKEEKPTDVIC